MRSDLWFLGFIVSLLVMLLGVVGLLMCPDLPPVWGWILTWFGAILAAFAVGRITGYARGIQKATA